MANAKTFSEAYNIYRLQQALTENKYPVVQVPSVPQEDTYLLGQEPVQHIPTVQEQHGAVAPGWVHRSLTSAGLGLAGGLSKLGGFLADAAPTLDNFSRRFVEGTDKKAIEEFKKAEDFNDYMNAISTALPAMTSAGRSYEKAVQPIKDKVLLGTPAESFIYAMAEAIPTVMPGVGSAGTKAVTKTMLKKAVQRDAMESVASKVLQTEVKELTEKEIKDKLLETGLTTKAIKELVNKESKNFLADTAKQTMYKEAAKQAMKTAPLLQKAAAGGTKTLLNRTEELLREGPLAYIILEASKKPEERMNPLEFSVSWLAASMLLGDALIPAVSKGIRELKAYAKKSKAPKTFEQPDTTKPTEAIDVEPTTTSSTGEGFTAQLVKDITDPLKNMETKTTVKAAPSKLKMAEYSNHKVNTEANKLIRDLAEESKIKQEIQTKYAQAVADEDEIAKQFWSDVDRRVGQKVTEVKQKAITKDLNTRIKTEWEELKKITEYLDEAKEIVTTSKTIAQVRGDDLSVRLYDAILEKLEINSGKHFKVRERKPVVLNRENKIPDEILGEEPEGVLGKGKGKVKAKGGRVVVDLEGLSQEDALKKITYELKKKRAQKRKLEADDKLDAEKKAKAIEKLDEDIDILLAQRDKVKGTEKPKKETPKKERPKEKRAVKEGDIVTVHQRKISSKKNEAGETMKNVRDVEIENVKVIKTGLKITKGKGKNKKEYDAVLVKDAKGKETVVAFNYNGRPGKNKQISAEWVEPTQTHKSNKSVSGKDVAPDEKVTINEGIANLVAGETGEETVKKGKGKKGKTKPVEPEEEVSIDLDTPLVPETPALGKRGNRLNRKQISQDKLKKSVESLKETLGEAAEELKGESGKLGVIYRDPISTVMDHYGKEIVQELKEIALELMELIEAHLDELFAEYKIKKPKSREKLKDAKELLWHQMAYEEDNYAEILSSIPAATRVELDKQLFDYAYKGIRSIKQLKRDKEAARMVHIGTTDVEIPQFSVSTQAELTKLLTGNKGLHNYLEERFGAKYTDLLEHWRLLRSTEAANAKAAGKKANYNRKDIKQEFQNVLNLVESVWDDFFRNNADIFNAAKAREMQIDIELVDEHWDRWLDMFKIAKLDPKKIEGADKALLAEVQRAKNFVRFIDENYSMFLPLLEKHGEGKTLGVLRANAQKMVDAMNAGRLHDAAYYHRLLDQIHDAELETLETLELAEQIFNKHHINEKMNRALRSGDPRKTYERETIPKIESYLFLRTYVPKLNEALETENHVLRKLLDRYYDLHAEYMSSVRIPGRSRSKFIAVALNDVGFEFSQLAGKLVYGDKTNVVLSRMQRAYRDMYNFINGTGENQKKYRFISFDQLENVLEAERYDAELHRMLRKNRLAVGREYKTIADGLKEYDDLLNKFGFDLGSASVKDSWPKVIQETIDRLYAEKPTLNSITDVLDAIDKIVNLGQTIGNAVFRVTKGHTRKGYSPASAEKVLGSLKQKQIRELDRIVEYVPALTKEMRDDFLTLENHRRNMAKAQASLDKERIQTQEIIKGLKKNKLSTEEIHKNKTVAKNLKVIKSLTDVIEQEKDNIDTIMGNLEELGLDKQDIINIEYYISRRKDVIGWVNQVERTVKRPLDDPEAIASFKRYSDVMRKRSMERYVETEMSKARYGCEEYLTKNADIIGAWDDYIRKAADTVFGDTLDKKTHIYELYDRYDNLKRRFDGSESAGDIYIGYQLNHVAKKINQELCNLYRNVKKNNKKIPALPAALKKEITVREKLADMAKNGWRFIKDEKGSVKLENLTPMWWGSKIKQLTRIAAQTIYDLHPTKTMWVSSMVKQFGNGVKAHLDEVWAKAHSFIAELVDSIKIKPEYTPHFIQNLSVKDRTRVLFGGKPELENPWVRAIDSKLNKEWEKSRLVAQEDTNALFKEIVKGNEEGIVHGISKLQQLMDEVFSPKLYAVDPNVQFIGGKVQEARAFVRDTVKGLTDFAENIVNSSLNERYYLNFDRLADLKTSSLQNQVQRMSEFYDNVLKKYIDIAEKVYYLSKKSPEEYMEIRFALKEACDQMSKRVEYLKGRNNRLAKKDINNPEIKENKAEIALYKEMLEVYGSILEHPEEYVLYLRKFSSFIKNDIQSGGKLSYLTYGFNQLMSKIVSGWDIKDPVMRNLLRLGPMRAGHYTRSVAQKKIKSVLGKLASPLERELFEQLLLHLGLEDNLQRGARELDISITPGEPLKKKGLRAIDYGIPLEDIQANIVMLREWIAEIPGATERIEQALQNHKELIDETLDMLVREGRLSKKYADNRLNWYFPYQIKEFTRDYLQLPDHIDRMITQEANKLRNKYRIPDSYHLKRRFGKKLTETEYINTDYETVMFDYYSRLFMQKEMNNFYQTLHANYTPEGIIHKRLRELSGKAERGQDVSREIELLKNELELFDKSTKKLMRNNKMYITDDYINFQGKRYYGVRTPHLYSIPENLAMVDRNKFLFEILDALRHRFGDLDNEQFTKTLREVLDYPFENDKSSIKSYLWLPEDVALQVSRIYTGALEKDNIWANLLKTYTTGFKKSVLFRLNLVPYVLNNMIGDFLMLIGEDPAMFKVWQKEATLWDSFASLFETETVDWLYGQGGAVSKTVASLGGKKIAAGLERRANEIRNFEVPLEVLKDYTKISNLVEMNAIKQGSKEGTVKIDLQKLAELEDIQMSGFWGEVPPERLTGGLRAVGSGPMRKLRQADSVIMNVIQKREDLLRLAKFYKDVKRVAKGEQVVITPREELKALQPLHRAGWAARASLIDYSALTPEMQGVWGRGFLLPFLTWYANATANFVRWFGHNTGLRKLINPSFYDNVPMDSTSAKLTRLALMIIPAMLIDAWNNTGPRADIEAVMPQSQRGQMHIILVNDELPEGEKAGVLKINHPYHTVGALLGGINNIPMFTWDVIKGRRTAGEAVKEYVTDSMWRDPLLSAGSQLTPVIRAPLEAGFNVKFWSDTPLMYEGATPQTLSEERAQRLAHIPQEVFPLVGRLSKSAIQTTQDNIEEGDSVIPAALKGGLSAGVGLVGKNIKPTPILPRDLDVTRLTESAKWDILENEILIPREKAREEIKNSLIYYWATGDSTRYQKVYDEYVNQQRLLDPKTVASLHKDELFEIRLKASKLRRRIVKDKNQQEALDAEIERLTKLYNQEARRKRTPKSVRLQAEEAFRQRLEGK